MPKKIVYLLGSGATHAVVRESDSTSSLLTADIQDFIRKKPRPAEIEPTIWSELLKTRDVEHLISVLDFQHRRSTSERVRSLYRTAIIALARETVKNLRPNLYTVLCDIHLNIPNSILDEQLTCFLTLNYEDILERTIAKHHRRSVNYGIESEPKPPNGSISVYKLHGSFNWITSCPVEVRSTIASSNSLWIPPGVDKRIDHYPFNLLWGKATEALMDCDVLRLVGCSLSRNDWGLIPIIYTVQRFHKAGKMTIEVIDFPANGKMIEDTYGYLKIKRFDQLVEILEQYRKQFTGATDDDLASEIRSAFEDRDKTNPFASWLDAKIESVVDSAGLGNQPLATAKYAYRFYNKV